MSRRDIIIISVLVNTGLLAMLFVTAIKTDAPPFLEQQTGQLAQAAPLPHFSEPTEEVALNEVSAKKTVDSSHQADEVDLVLRDYLPEIQKDSTTSSPPPSTPSKLVKEEPLSADGNFVEVVVKSGDALEKLARANRTTIEAIKKANGLQSDRLKIGQVLKVPVGGVKAKAEAPKKAAEVVSISNEPVYYVVKPGDNPWKIAKLHHVKFDDLLILNQLDEETAKNLKVGERVRVR